MATRYPKSLADAAAKKKRRVGASPLGVVRAASLQRDVPYYSEQERLLLEQSNRLQAVVERNAARFAR
jgi:hypothetical protein